MALGWSVCVNLDPPRAYHLLVGRAGPSSWSPRQFTQGKAQGCELTEPLPTLRFQGLASISAQGELTLAVWVPERSLPHFSPPAVRMLIHRSRSQLGRPLGFPEMVLMLSLPSANNCGGHCLGEASKVRERKERCCLGLVFSLTSISQSQHPDHTVPEYRIHYFDGSLSHSLFLLPNYAL